MKLTDLRQKTRRIAVQYDGDVLNVQYRPGQITPANRLLLIRASDGGSDNRERQAALADFTTALAAWIESWDLLGDDGKALPVTADLLLSLPDGLIRAIVDGIFEDNRPNDSTAGS